MYFLSRPRRFGKSLLLSTLRAVFQGQQQLLFADLHLSSTDYTWEKFEVLQFNFAAYGHRVENLEHLIKASIKDYAARYEINLPDTSISLQFKSLIEQVAEKKDQWWF